MSDMSKQQIKILNLLLTIFRAASELEKLEFHVEEVKMDVDILKNKTYDMIKLHERKVVAIGKWMNNEQKQILKSKINNSDPSKFARLPTNKNEYLKALVDLGDSAEHYLDQIYGFTSTTGISKITMSSHSNNYCGGYGIRIRIKNPEGEECITSREDSNPGNLFIWNNPNGGNCKDMEISWLKTRVYIESNSGNDFCPKVVKIYTTEATYETNEIHSWYDYSSNSLQHFIHVV